jgi:hypothetical protein
MCVCVCCCFDFVDGLLLALFIPSNRFFLIFGNIQDQFEVGSESVCTLAAWALQAAHGDYAE